MDVDELRALFGLSRRTIRKYVALGIIEAPTPARGPHARYAPDSVARIRAFQALKHNNTCLAEVAALLREDGISIVEYVRRREESIRRHGLGVA